MLGVASEVYTRGRLWGCILGQVHQAVPCAEGRAGEGRKGEADARREQHVVACLVIAAGISGGVDQNQRVRGARHDHNVLVVLFDVAAWVLVADSRRDGKLARNGKGVVDVDARVVVDATASGGIGNAERSCSILTGDKVGDRRDSRTGDDRAGSAILSLHRVGRVVECNLGR